MLLLNHHIVITLLSKQAVTLMQCFWLFHESWTWAYCSATSAGWVLLLLYVCWLFETAPACLVV